MDFSPGTIDEVRTIVQEEARVLPHGGRTKPALSLPKEGESSLDLTGLSGILEYEPGELTFTALAGTPVALVEEALAENGQYLPFDPPFSSRGATLGGTVAAGVSGPRRYRYGGVRDFILGIRYVNSEGQLVKSGGKVVKNAAGFDLPKLMVGSCGALGVLVEITFKVFPDSEAFATLRLESEGLERAMDLMYTLASSPVNLDALDLAPIQSGYVLWARIGGLATAIEGRLQRLSKMVGDYQLLDGEAEKEIWVRAREFEWIPESWSLVKIPITPAKIATFEADLKDWTFPRRYSAGGQVLWLALDREPGGLDELLTAHGLSGQVLIGNGKSRQIGLRRGRVMLDRVKAAMDPAHRFVEA